MQADVADVNVRSTIDPIQVTAWRLTVQMQVSGKVEAVQGKLRLEATVSDGTPGRTMAEPAAPRVSQ